MNEQVRELIDDLLEIAKKDMGFIDVRMNLTSMVYHSKTTDSETLMNMLKRLEGFKRFEVKYLPSFNVYNLFTYFDVNKLNGGKRKWEILFFYFMVCSYLLLLLSICYYMILKIEKGKRRW